jgi:hypothetical protein
VFWLGEIFTELGCHAAPALDCTEAVSITSALNLTIDLVVVNPRLRGVSKMMKKLSRADRSLKVVVIRDGNVEAISGLPAHAILERPVGRAAISRERWLNRVRKILRDVLVAGVE